MSDNSKALEYAKEIVVAKVSNSTIAINQASGQNVADYLEAVFNKLVELEKRSSND